MDEGEFNSKTPIGRLILEVTKQAKKCEVDEQFGQILKEFREHTIELQSYLNNGIFKGNFAEAGLFLSKCAVLYGKRVDAFWDELLNFHTRLIEYDVVNAEEKGKVVDQNVVNKLEERRNRNKRRKKFKLLKPEDENLEKVILNNGNGFQQLQESNEVDEDLLRNWKRLEFEAETMGKTSPAIYKQQLKMYRMDNSHGNAEKCCDFDINNDDGEFITKYSRMPGWKHIYDLFEYNNEGLLPDKNNTIAKLKLSTYGRIQYMLNMNIPFETPYKKYKDEYLKYRHTFFALETGKWQNMPLDTFDDLHKQLMFLAAKERENNNCNNTLSFISIPKIIGQDEIIDCSNRSSPKQHSPKQNSSNEDLMNFSLDTCINNSELIVRIEQLSNKDIDTKLRQDSGFYDTPSDEDDNELFLNNENSLSLPEQENSDKINENSLSLLEQENSDKINENSLSLPEQENSDKMNDNSLSLPENENSISLPENENSDKNNENSLSLPEQENSDKMNDNSLSLPENENSDKINENSISLPENENSDKINENSLSLPENENSDKINENSDKNNENSLSLPENENSLSLPENENSDKNNENSLSLPENGNSDKINENSDKLNKKLLQNNDSNQIISDENKNNNTDDDFDTRSILSDHSYCKSVENDDSNIVSLNVINKSIIPIMKETLKKKMLKRKNMEPPPPGKRIRLTKKQIEKLSKSLVPPVKMIRFEKFYSENYNPQIGEGEVEPVNYESEDDEDNVDNIENDENSHFGENDENNHYEENDENSHFGENDDTLSIFSDHSYCQPAQNKESEQFDDSGIQIVDSSQLTTSISEDNDEYQKLLKSLELSRNDGNALNMSNEEPDPREKEMSMLRIKEWKRNILPVLKNLKENDFNVHVYGSKIMDGMEVNEVKPFKKIIKGKSASDLMKDFVASLHLANTGNIEITNAPEGTLANNFNIKLVKRDRYHEKLDAYEVPSKGICKERLKKMRSQKDTKGVPAERDADEPPIKKTCKKYKLGKKQCNNLYKSPINTEKNNKITQSTVDMASSTSTAQNYSVPESMDFLNDDWLNDGILTSDTFDDNLINAQLMGINKQSTPINSEQKLITQRECTPKTLRF